MRVAIVLDDAPPSGAMGNVAICKADETSLPDSVGAIVISSEHYEAALHARAQLLYGHLNIPIVRIYEDPTMVHVDSQLIEHLVHDLGVSESDACWLIENRGERHDATLPMLPPERTELHLRRYELARDLIRNLGAQSVIDMASGTGYGSEMLADKGDLLYTGVDINARAVDYANRRFGNEHRQFICASVCDLDIDDEQYDLVASFETIEHVDDSRSLVNEYARMLRHKGQLVVSTPNRLGPTPYHVHDFDYAQLAEVLAPHFEVQELIGQLPNDTVYDPTLPPGMWYIDPNAVDGECIGPEGRRPDYLIVIARQRGSMARRSIGMIDHETQTVVTKHGSIHLYCPNETVRWRAQTLLTKEPETIEWLDEFESGDVYWDIGASTGPYVMYAVAAGHAGKIFAFEPSPWNWWVLAEQIRRAGIGHAVQALPVAIGENNAIGTLHMRHPMPGGAGSSFGEPKGEFGETFTPSFEQGAIAITIDDLVGRYGLECPNRIKIDVDGNELGVIRGAKKTLARSEVRSVLIELDDSRQALIDEVTQIMNQSGLRLASKRHAPEVDSSPNSSIYNFVFARAGA